VKAACDPGGWSATLILGRSGADELWVNMEAGTLEAGFSEFVSLTLNHGVGSVEKGGPLIPFVLVASNGGRQIKRFNLDRLDEAVDAAFAFASDAQTESSRVAVAFDGSLTWEGKRTDAIYVEASDGTTSAHVLVAQRYARKRRFSKLRRLGNPVYLDAAGGRLR
jgi:hypothetical protein